MPTVVDLVAVEHLADALTAADVPSSADPGLVRTPGAWIRHTGVSLDRLGGSTHLLQLHLVVADNGYLRSRNALFALFNQLLAVLDPDGDPFFQGLALPDTKPLPGLVVPFNLPDDYRFEPEE